MPDTIRRIGGYVIVRPLKAGGMGTVYLARQIELDREVALKELKGFGHGSELDEQYTRRFKREARAIASLSHPNIVTVYEFFVHNDVPYMSMEFLPHGSLSPYMRDPLSLAQIGGILSGTLAGLAHAAENGIVHRDLKPDNLMVSREGRIKIGDFGIAKAPGPLFTDDVVTTPNRHPGTPRYMAPEQVLGEEVGVWTDLYALGLIAWELFAKRHPHPYADSPVAQMMFHLTRDIASLETEVDVDAGMSNWVARLLAKEPGERTRSPQEARDELDALLSALIGSDWDRHASLPRVEAAHELGGPYTPPPENLPSEPLSAAELTPTPPKHEASKRRPWRSWKTSTLVGAPVVAAVVALTAVTWPEGQQPEELGEAAKGGTPKPLTLAAGPLRATAAGTWKRVRHAPTVDGLTLDPQVAVAPATGEDHGAVLVGIAPKSAENPQLLPTTFLDGLGYRRDSAPKPEKVELGGELVAYHYQGLRPPELGRSVDVYVAPTSAGIAAVGCIAPEVPSAEFDTQCRAIATSLHPSEASAVTLGPDPQLASTVSKTLAALDREVRAGRKKLREAKHDKRDYQAAARTIALAFHVAAESIAELDAGPSDASATRSLERALLGAARAYNELAGRDRTASALRPGVPAKRGVTLTTKKAGRLATSADDAARFADQALGRLIRNGYSGDIGPRVPTTTVPRYVAPKKKSSVTSTNPPANGGSTADSGTSTTSETPPSTQAGPRNGTGTRSTQEQDKQSGTEAEPNPTADAPITTDG